MKGLGVGRLPSAGFVTLTAILLIICLPPNSDAQSYPSSGSLEVGGGAFWVGGSDAGAATAEETQNQTGAAGSITLFDTNARFASTPGVGGRLGFNLTSTIALEGELIYSRPQMAVSISNDFEGASDVTLENPSVHQYFIDGGIVVHLNNLRFNARGVPFFRAGIGYLRQLTAGRQAIETGQVYQVGGGFKQLVGAGRRVGVRFDVRAAISKGGLSFDEHGQHAFIVLGGSVFVVF